MRKVNWEYIAQRGDSWVINFYNSDGFRLETWEADKNEVKISVWDTRAGFVTPIPEEKPVEYREVAFTEFKPQIPENATSFSVMWKRGNNILGMTSVKERLETNLSEFWNYIKQDANNGV